MPGPWSLQVGYASAQDFANMGTRCRFARNVQVRLQEAETDPDMPESYKIALKNLHTVLQKVEEQADPKPTVLIRSLMADTEHYLSEASEELVDPSDLIQCFHLWTLTAFYNNSEESCLDGFRPALDVFCKVFEHSKAIDEVKKCHSSDLAYREEKEVVIEWALYLRSMEDLKFCCTYSVVQSLADLGWLYHHNYGRTYNTKLQEVWEMTKIPDEKLTTVRQSMKFKVQTFLDQNFYEQTSKYTCFWLFSTLVDCVDMSCTGIRPLTPAEQADMADGVMDAETNPRRPPSFFQAVQLIREKRREKFYVPNTSSIVKEPFNSGMFAIGPERGKRCIEQQAQQAGIGVALPST